MEPISLLTAMTESKRSYLDLEKISQTSTLTNKPSMGVIASNTVFSKQPIHDGRMLDVRDNDMLVIRGFLKGDTARIQLSPSVPEDVE